MTTSYLINIFSCGNGLLVLNNDILPRILSFSENTINNQAVISQIKFNDIDYVNEEIPTIDDKKYDYIFAKCSYQSIDNFIEQWTDYYQNNNLIKQKNLLDNHKSVIKAQKMLIDSLKQKGKDTISAASTLKKLYSEVLNDMENNLKIELPIKE